MADWRMRKRMRRDKEGIGGREASFSATGNDVLLWLSA
jgi:hypothetical protein